MTSRIRRLGAAVLTAGITASLLAGLAAPAEAAPSQSAKSKEDKARETSRSVLADTLRRHGNSGAAHGVAEQKVESDALGMTHVRVRQTYEGVPVWGAEAIVHVAGDDSVASVTDAFADQVSPGAGTKATVTADEAVAVAREASNTPAADVVGTPDLWIVRDGNVDVLAWRVRLMNIDTDEHPSIPVVFVNARSARVVTSYENLQEADGTGNGMYSGTVSLTTNLNGSVYELKDATRGNQAVHSANNSTYLPGTLMADADNVWGDSTPDHTQTAAVEAAYAATKTWDYFKNVHGRNGIWNNGVGAKSTVHYSNAYVNAFWNGTQMVYGDGENNDRPLASLDVGGHEMTHGVTENTAGLIYSGESGGLNEATSDILGAAVEFSAGNPADPGDYLIGEKINVFGDGTPLRYMDKPSRDGASKDCWYSGLGSIDVHYSSGPANHFFYLLAEGSGAKTINGVAYNSPTCNGSTVAGIGRAAAEKIWYRALTAYFTSSTNYAGARTGTLSAATDLYGANSIQYNAVCAAWAAVSVGSCGTTPAPTPTTKALVNGVPMSSLSGAQGSTQFFTLAVPSGASGLSFALSGGTGDADMYVKFGSAPTTSSYDCRPYLNGNNETCTIATAQAGTYYVMLHGYTAFSGASLVGKYSGGSTTSAELVGNGGFEGSASPWTLSSFLYVANGNFPHGGTGYIYGGTANSAAQSAYQQITIPSTAAANLSFWLNVTSEETTTTTQYDKLFVEVRNTAGTLLGTVGTYSNLNKTTAGTYSQKAFSLAAYRGQTVRLQFRVTTDSSLPTTFRIDDVSVK